MKHFDTVIRGGTVVTAADSTECDVGIIDGRVAALGLGFDDADRVIDATGKLVLPGGVEGHCQKGVVAGSENNVDNLLLFEMGCQFCPTFIA